MLLDKNPEKTVTNGLDLIKEEFEENVPSLVACSDPFDKAEFLVHLINSASSPIVFVDLDFMHSGYVKSGMIKERGDLTIVQPDRDSWAESLTEIISKTSKERFLIIVDSLNGAYNMFDDLDSARFVNSSLMLLSSVGRQARSPVIITAMIRRKEGGGWVLSPSRKQLMQSSKTGTYYAKRDGRWLFLSRLGRDSSERFLIAERFQVS